MSKHHTITATLQAKNFTFGFNGPKLTNVKYGDEVQWKVNVRDVKDPSQVEIFLAFTGSNSQIPPPKEGLGHAYDPMEGPYADNAAPSANPREAMDAQVLLQDSKNVYSTGDHVTVRRDKSVPQKQSNGKTVYLPVVYNYKLTAFIPAAQLPDGIAPNSDNTSSDFPNFHTDGGSKTLIVSDDPEMHVDEC